MNRGDVSVSAALLLFCACGLSLTTTFHDVPATLSQNVPPTFFPRLVLGLLAALSLALGVSAFERERRKLGSGTEAAPIPSVVLVTSVLFIAVAALIPLLGMRVSVAAAAVAIPLYWGERSVVRLTALAIALPLLVHFLFGVALRMRFPSGLLF